MGKMNLLKANWEGRVGETVGAKWKDKKTIRTYTKPSNPNTQAQQTVRGVFKEMTSFVALFADGIKYLNALDTSGMSARNAIIKINKDQIQTGAFDKATLLISKGGLQKPQGATAANASGVFTVTWTPPTAVNFTSKARAVCVVVNEDTLSADIFTGLASAGTATGTVAIDTPADASVYLYFLDERGSNKVCSNSVFVA